MADTVVDRLHGEFKSLITYLQQQGELSLAITAQSNLRKALLMTAASYFENRITEDITKFVDEMTNSNILVTEFVRNKAIARQYHTFFDWERPNANKFFSSFGDGFKTFMSTELRGDDSLNESIRAFLEIGYGRNQLAHEDFGSFPLEKTEDEIYERYKLALRFVDEVPKKLRKFLEQIQNEEKS